MPRLLGDHGRGEALSVHPTLLHVLSEGRLLFGFSSIPSSHWVCPLQSAIYDAEAIAEEEVTGRRTQPMPVTMLSMRPLADSSPPLTGPADAANVAGLDRNRTRNHETALDCVPNETPATVDSGPFPQMPTFSSTGATPHDAVATPISTHEKSGQYLVSAIEAFDDIAPEKSSVDAWGDASPSDEMQVEECGQDAYDYIDVSPTLDSTGSPVEEATDSAVGTQPDVEGGATDFAEDPFVFS